MTLLVGLGAINTGNNLLYLVLGMMLSQIIISGILSETVLRQLTFDHRLPPFIHARTPVDVVLCATNAKRFASSLSVEVVLHVETTSMPRFYFLQIPAQAERCETTRTQFARRGCVKLTGYTVRTTFPFGMFVKYRNVSALQELLILPRLHPVAQPPSPAGEQMGERAQNAVGPGDEFYALRDYRTGEDRRLIHWKVTARRGKPIIRETERQKARSVRLVLANLRESDASQTADREGEPPLELAGPSATGRSSGRRRAPKRAPQHLELEPTGYDLELEEMVDMAASLAAHYLALGYAVSMQTLDGRVSEGHGPAQLRRILRFLALVPFPSTGDARRPRVETPSSEVTCGGARDNHTGSFPDGAASLKTPSRQEGLEPHETQVRQVAGALPHLVSPDCVLIIHRRSCSRLGALPDRTVMMGSPAHDGME